MKMSKLIYNAILYRNRIKILLSSCTIFLKHILLPSILYSLQFISFIRNIVSVKFNSKR